MVIRSLVGRPRKYGGATQVYFGMMHHQREPMTEQSGNEFYPTKSTGCRWKRLYTTAPIVWPPGPPRIAPSSQVILSDPTQQPASLPVLPIRCSHKCTSDLATVPSPVFFPMPQACRPHASITFLVLLEALVGSVYSCRDDPCLPLPRDASPWLVSFSTRPVVTSVDHPGVDVGAGVVVLVCIQAICRAQYVVGILGLPSSVA
jgi:hypothetical protein